MKDLVVFSHLRWGFAFQRPQHIMSGLAEKYRIVFIEEELISECDDGYTVSNVASNIWVIQPRLQDRNHIFDIPERKRTLLNTILHELAISDYIAWYYTPMAYAFSGHLQPILTVYDCSGELSAVFHSRTELIHNEAELLKAAHLVFTGGASLYKIKKDLNHAVCSQPHKTSKEEFRKAGISGGFGPTRALGGLAEPVTALKF